MSKREARKLVFYIEGGVFAGVILRESGVDRVFVRKFDESFLKQLANESSLKEVRETIMLAGSRDSLSVKKALSPRVEELPGYKSFLKSIVSETLRLLRYRAAP